MYAQHFAQELRSAYARALLTRTALVWIGLCLAGWLVG